MRQRYAMGKVDTKQFFCPRITITRFGRCHLLARGTLNEVAKQLSARCVSQFTQAPVILSKAVGKKRDVWRLWSTLIFSLANFDYPRHSFHLLAKHGSGAPIEPGDDEIVRHADRLNKPRGQRQPLRLVLGWRRCLKRALVNEPQEQIADDSVSVQERLQFAFGLDSHSGRCLSDRVSNVESIIIPQLVF